MNWIDVCLFLITIGILGLLVAVIRSLSNASIKIEVKLELPEPVKTETAAPITGMVETDPEQEQLFQAARQIQALFLNDEQMTEETEVKKVV